MADHRPLYEIAREIAADWKKVNFAAVPYLEALHALDGIDGYFYHDPAAHIVRYFLGNATSWRGPVARRIKAELKGMV